MLADLLLVVYDALQSFAKAREIPIEIPNVSPPDALDGSRVYLRAAVEPSDPFVHGIGDGEALHTWIVLVTVHTLDNAGEIEIAETLDALADAFPYGSYLAGELGNYLVSRTFAPRPPIREAGGYYIPTRMRVQAVG